MMVAVGYFCRRPATSGTAEVTSPTDRAWSQMVLDLAFLSAESGRQSSAEAGGNASAVFAAAGNKKDEERQENQ